MLLKLKRLLQEIKSLIVFYGIEKERRKIIFYAEDSASYGYFEGLIEHLTLNKDLDVCYFTSDSQDPLLTAARPNIRVFYLNCLLWLFTITLDSKIIIMTMPDLHRFHIKRSQRGAHHIYLFHNIGSSFPVIRFGALFHYDTIFCAGNHHIAEIQRQEELYSLPKKNLVKFGYYRLEKIYQQYNNYLRTAKKAPCQYKARILLGPSWGPNSILDLCGSKLIKVLLNANFEVILRPHPMTRIKNPSLLDSLNQEFRRYPNYIFEDKIDAVESVYRSDLLISDWSGIVFEYAFGTERPVLFIDVPQKIVNERFKEVGIIPIDAGIRKRIGAVLARDELEKAPLAISDLLKNKDAYTGEIIKARGELVYNFGESSRIGAEFICSFLDKSQQK